MIPLGERLIEQETTLDRAFAGRTITPPGLTEMTAAIGATQATLRAAHLRYHLEQIAVLSPEQVQHYNMLRGYAGMEGHGTGAHDPSRHHAK